MPTHPLSHHLQTLGFSKNTAKVYLTLFEFGEAKAGQIVQNTGMHRNLVYRALEELEQKKMITRTQKSGVARFRVLDPSHIMNELKEKENLAQHIIETLKTSYKENAQEVVVREGYDEIGSFYIEESKKLSADDEWLLIGLASDWFIHTPGYFEKYALAHKAAGYHVKSITSTFTDTDLKLIQMANKLIPGLIEVRSNPDISFDSIEINILPDKIVICIFVEPYTVIEIKNRKFVDAYRAYFYSLWHQDVKTYKGWNEMEQLYFQEILPSLGQGDEEFVIAGGYDMPKDKKRFKDFFLRYNTQGVKQKFTKYFVIPEKNVMDLYKEMHDSGDIDGSYGKIRGIAMQHGSPLEIYIYKDRAILAIWGDEPSATVYHKQEVIDGFKKQFELLWNQTVQTYTGWDELRSLFFDTLLPTMKPGMKEYVMASGYDMPDDAYNQQQFAQFFLDYNKEGVKQGFEKHATICEKYRTNITDEMKNAGDTGAYAHIRFIPDEHASPIETHIFPDRVVLIAWKGIPTATVYTREDIREGFLKQFEVLWNLGKK